MIEAAPAAMSPLYEQPVLVVDPGMHTAMINCVTADAAGRLAVSGSDDKTVRVWSLADGKLKRTLRMPAGPGNIGKIYAVAMSPEGDLVAAGGWTKWTKDATQDLIYLFEARTGKMVQVISGLPASTHSLAFSPDGRYMAAGLYGRDGLRIFDRDEKWAEVFRDTDYADSIYGVAFAADGRLATTSLDGMIRLYDGSPRLVVPPKNGASGNEPFGIAFSPGGAKLAVGYADVSAVDLFDGQSLAMLPRPNLDGLAPGAVAKVAWSADGATLFAGLNYAGDCRPVLAWAESGQGERRVMQAGNGNTIIGLAALPGGGLLVAAADPFLAVLKADGGVRWARSSTHADFRAQDRTLAISAEGAIVDFSFEMLGKSPLRFDLRARKLNHDPPADDQLGRPKQDGLPIENWEDEHHPTLDGQPIALEPYERSRSLAVPPDGSRFVLGAEWSLRVYSAKGELRWRRHAPGTAWAVNIASDGRLAVAAYGDGTIRWHRMDDGRELLALYVLADKQNWVAWTPEGFYGATPGAFGVLRWHVNRGFDAAAETVPVSDIPRLRRPDALPFVLQELETARALGIADMIAARRDVQIRTGAAKAPGARLHVLAIGVSDYGEKAAGLALKFAHKDAEDVASALLNTQGGGLYAEVLPIFLPDGAATKAGIFEALAAMEMLWGERRTR
jgi:WD40 repeat protein